MGNSFFVCLLNVYVCIEICKDLEQNNCSNNFWMADDFSFFSLLTSVYYRILKTMSISYLHNRITLFLKMEDST